MRGAMTRTDSAATTWSENQPAPVVATEVVLLWPQGIDADADPGDVAGLWPVFVLVVSEPRDLLGSPVRTLFDLLDAPKGPDEITVVGGRTRWSVVDPRRALLRLTLLADAPVRFESDVLVPAERVLGVLDVLARGATIGITTSRHAAGLHARVDVHAALRHLVLLGCPPSPELRELTEELCGAQV